METWSKEHAECYRLLLMRGLREEFDERLERSLAEEEPLSPLVLELAFCMSSLPKTISTLREFTLDCKIDEEKLYAMVMDALRRRYIEKRLTLKQTVENLYAVVRTREVWDEQPWFELDRISYTYELVVDGLLPEAVFRAAFEAFFLQGERFDIEAYAKP